MTEAQALFSALPEFQYELADVDQQVSRVHTEILKLDNMVVAALFALRGHADSLWYKSCIADFNNGEL